MISSQCAQKSIKKKQFSSALFYFYNYNYSFSERSVFLSCNGCFSYVQDDVEEWLEDLGLHQYWPQFESNGYKEPCDLEDLKGLDKKSLKETFHIWKRGHLNKLVLGIRKLQYPHEGMK